MKSALIFVFAIAAFAQPASKPCIARSHYTCVEDSSSIAVSHQTPFPDGCNGDQQGTNYRNAPTEPWIAADPKNPLHFIGAWQQDRWADGASSGLVNGVTFDGGRTWTTSLAKFSICSGGAYDRASDPWVSISPDGTVHQISLSVSQNNTISAILASKSNDGGLTWTDPITLINDGNAAFNDKESLTADPLDARYVYAVWDRALGSLNNNTYEQPTWFSRSTDGGETWEPARIIFNPGINGQSSGSQIVVLPDGTLVNVMLVGFQLNRQTARLVISVIRSTDKGETWSEPVTVSDFQANGIVDVKTGTPVRAGAGLPSIAADPVSGTLYVAWEDSRFTKKRDGIALSRSLDRGATWSAPFQVNQAPLVQAFEPAIAVDRNGTVAIDYFDFRKDTDDADELLTSSWRIVSSDGGRTWQEFALAGPFDMLNAALSTNRGYFVGDYHAIVPSPEGFLSLFVTVNPAGATERQTVIAVRTPERGNTETTAREQINLNRYRPRVHEPPRKH